MHEARAKLIEDSFQIAWDYLEATGELSAPDIAASTLLDTIEALVKHGERRRLFALQQSDQRVRALSGGAEAVAGLLEEPDLPHCVFLTRVSDSLESSVAGIHRNVRHDGPRYARDLCSQARAHYHRL